MRKPFKEAQAAMVAEGGSPKDHNGSGNVVWVGRVFELDVFEGGSYSNRGTHYVSARVRLLRRRVKGATFAAQRAAELLPDLWALASNPPYPRTDAAATALLEAAVALDVQARRFLEEGATLEAEQTRLAGLANQRAFERREARTEVEKEVIRLFREGLLDDSNVLAGLRAIATKLVDEHDGPEARLPGDQAAA